MMLAYFLVLLLLTSNLFGLVLYCQLARNVNHYKIKFYLNVSHVINVFLIIMNERKTK